MARCVGVLVILILCSSVLFAVAPSVTDMLNMGYSLEYIARYILTHASEFEPYMVEVAKVFLASGGGAVTGAAALSTWAKFAAITAWGLVAGLATYDIVKAVQLIGALVELRDIKKGIAAVREVQRFDRLGIQMMSGSGKYQEWYVLVESNYDSKWMDTVTYRFYFKNARHFDGNSIVLHSNAGNFLCTYYKDGNKSVQGILGGVSNSTLDFLYSSGVYSKAVQIALSGSYTAPAVGIWELYTPGWGKIVVGAPTSGPNAPLFSEGQPVGVITTAGGASLVDALTPEEWGNVRKLTDIAPLLRFQYMPYSAYRNVPSYDDAPVQEKWIDTSKITFDSNSNTWNNVSPETVQEVQQRLETLTQTIQSILSQIQQVLSVSELQEQYETLQRTQLQLTELVQNLSQTLSQLQTQTQSNAETLQQLQEQFQAAVELMQAVQPALESLNQIQSQVQTVVEKLEGVMTENDIIVRSLTDVRSALETIKEEFPQLKQEVQSTVEILRQLETKTQERYETILSKVQEVQSTVEVVQQLQSQTQQQYETILSKVQDIDASVRMLSQIVQNISVNVDLSGVVQAVNEVAARVDALGEKIDSLREYLESETFFEKIGNAVKKALKELFVPDPKRLEEIVKINLPDYGRYARFGADVEFSSSSDSIKIELFGASADIGSEIRKLTTPLRPYVNVFIVGLTAFFVIRAFKVHLVID